MDALTVMPLASLDEHHGTVTALHADGEAVVVGTSAGKLLLFEAPDDLSLADRPKAECELCPSGEKLRKAQRAVRELSVLGSSGVVLALCLSLIHISEPTRPY